MKLRLEQLPRGVEIPGTKYALRRGVNVIIAKSDTVTVSCVACPIVQGEGQDELTARRALLRNIGCEIMNRGNGNRLDVAAFLKRHIAKKEACKSDSGVVTC